MRVPFLDLRPAYLELQKELEGECARVLRSGHYVLGQEVEAFEREFAKYLSCRHCIGVGSGLDAICLILRACGVGPGDEVIVPSNTFIATWLAVSHVGAIPVPVDPDPTARTIEPSRVAGAISSRTKAIIPVHLYGQPADMDPLCSMAREFGLWVIEDAAQAHGAEYKGRKAGALGDAGAFSFYPTKNLGGFGDGGAVVTDSDDLAEKVKILRNYGSREKYHNEVKGYNSRLDPLQCALLRAKLGRLDEWNDKRRRIAGLYRDALADVSQIVLPVVPKWANPVWHVFVIRHPDRDRLLKHLEQRGIGAMIHYPVPPHLSGAYAREFPPQRRLPVAEELAASVLSLPMGPHLGEECVPYVVSAIKDFLSTDKEGL